MTQRESNQENSLPTSNDQTLSERLRDCVKVTFSAGLHGVESDCRQAAEELDRQRAEIERLRDTERKFGALMHDVMDERDRLRAALGDILHYQGHLNSNVQVDMQSIARNALRASPFETKARRMTRAEADAMNRAFWRSVEIIDDVGALNRQLCEAEGHVFSRFAMHHCLRCEAAVTPGGYLAYTSQKAGEKP